MAAFSCNTQSGLPQDMLLPELKSKVVHTLFYVQKPTRLASDSDYNTGDGAESALEGSRQA